MAHSELPTGLVCVNGHAMDDGYFECPSCGAYRPSGCIKPGMTQPEQMQAIRRALNEQTAFPPVTAGEYEDALAARARPRGPICANCRCPLEDHDEVDLRCPDDERYCAPVGVTGADRRVSA